MLAPAPQRGVPLGAARGIAERDGDVAQPAHVTDATDRAASGALEELRFGPRKQLDEPGRIEAVPWMEPRLGR